MDLYLIFGILIFLLALYLGICDPKKGLLLLVFLLPFNHKETLGFILWNLTPPRVFLVGLGFGFLIYALRNVRDWQEWLRQFLGDTFFVFLFLLWAVQGISLFRAINLEMGFGMWGFSTAVLALYIIFHFLVVKYGESFLKQTKRLYLQLGLVIGAFGIAQLILFLTQDIVFLGIWPIEDGLARVGSTFWDVNHFAAFSASIALLFFGRYVFASGREASLNFVAFLFMVLMVGLSSSQSGMVFLVVGFLVISFFLLFQNYQHKYSLIFGLAIFLLVGAGGYFFHLGLTGESNLWQVLKVNLTLYDDSVAAHYHLAQGALEIFKERPLLGCGYGSFSETFRNTSVINTYLERDPIGDKRIPPHSIWFGALSETGALGFFVFLGLFAVLFLRCFRNIFKAQNGSQFVQNSVYLGILMGVSAAGLVYSYNLLFFWFLLFIIQEYSFQDALSLAGVRFWPKFKDWVICHKEKLILIFLVLFSGTFVFWFLWRNALIPWDEAIYAGVSREMVEGGDIFTLHWNREPFFEKPPLFFWLQAISFVYFDFKPFAARLSVALFGILGVVMTYLFGKKLFSRRVGFFGSLFLATTIHWVAWSRTAMLDVPAAVLILISLYFFWLAFCEWKDPSSQRSQGRVFPKYKNWILFGVFLGLTVLMKGIVAVIPLVVVIAFIVVFQIIQAAVLRDKQRNFKFLILNFQIVKKVIGNWLLKIGNAFPLFLFTTLSFLIVAVPWHWLMIIKHGDSFVKEYFGYHVLERASESIEMHGRPFWWFNVVIRHWARYWYVVGVIAFFVLVLSLGFFVWKKWRSNELDPFQRLHPKLRSLITAVFEIKERHEFEAGVFIFLWLVLTFFIFSFSKSKIQWYIMPIYPPLALLCGWFTERLYKWFRDFSEHVISQRGNVKLKKSNTKNVWFSVCNLVFEICNFGGRVGSTLLIAAVILFVGVFGLFMNRRKWFPENLNKQVAELSDYVWRISGPPKKFYVADVPPPLPIFYSGLKVNTVTDEEIKGALKKPPVAVLSKQGTYKDVLEELQEEGRVPPIEFKETEDYILYGY
ncbi:MAG: glycosyltransferase family 39 protein [Patescibacteria group bacterium]|nr:glycosyltransferase family 39 protein [Patescibacteria group bacterium]